MAAADALGSLGAFLFPIWTFYAVPWILGLATALAGRFVGRPWHQAVGIGVMTVPVWDTLWGVIESFGPLLEGGLVLRPYTRHQLSGLYTYKFLADLGYLGVGFLAFAGDGTWRGFWAQTPRSLAARLASVGLPLGRRRWGIHGEGTSMLAGLLLFPLLLGSTFLVNWWLGGF